MRGLFLYWSTLTRHMLPCPRAHTCVHIACVVDACAMIAAAWATHGRITLSNVNCANTFSFIFAKERIRRRHVAALLAQAAESWHGRTCHTSSKHLRRLATFNGNIRLVGLPLLLQVVLVRHVQQGRAFEPHNCHRRFKGIPEGRGPWWLTTSLRGRVLAQLVSFAARPLDAQNANDSPA